VTYSLGAYQESLCCFGKNGGTSSSTHSMNFKKSNKQTFVVPRVLFLLCINKRKMSHLHQRVCSLQKYAALLAELSFE